MVSARKIGDSGEEKAARYLAGIGMRILKLNYQVRGGEIDIIARDGDATVFVEVKTRGGDGFGTGSQAITKRKKALLSRTALRYAYENGLLDTPMRFDVVVVHRSENHDIEYYKNAFETN